MKQKNQNYSVKDIEKYVQKYLEGRKDNCRYLSFEHCYLFFQKNWESKNKEVKKNIALHLFAYLASWGMMRNSFLMEKDYTYLVGIVDILAKNKRDEYNPSHILKIKKEIIKYFKDAAGDRKNWDTLTSKILMGTLGCVSAYDKYFKEAIKSCHNMHSSFDEKGLTDLFKFVEDNKDDIRKMQNLTKKRCGVIYPEMKIVDMYFWQKGMKF